MDDWGNAVAGHPIDIPYRGSAIAVPRVDKPRPPVLASNRNIVVVILARLLIVPAVPPERPYPVEGGHPKRSYVDHCAVRLTAPESPGKQPSTRLPADHRSNDPVASGKAVGCGVLLESDEGSRVLPRSMTAATVCRAMLVRVAQDAVSWSWVARSTASSRRRTAPTDVDMRRGSHSDQLLPTP